MTFFEWYPLLEGSHGSFRLQLSVSFLDQLCALIKPHLPVSLREIRVATGGQNRFRIFADLSDHLFQWLGSAFLNVLHDQGIEIEILEPCASLAQPWMKGRMETTLLGKHVAGLLIRGINQALSAGEDVLAMSTQWFSGQVFLSLNPFPLLRRYLPVAMSNHFTQVRWFTANDAMILEFDWRNSGVVALPLNDRGGFPMNQQIQAFLDRLVQSQFADLKGSSAKLSLQLSDKLLDELLALALHTQRAQNPWLALIDAATVKGAVQVDLELKV